MKAIENKEKFIEMRVRGFSYDKISKELNVSKQTLLNWGQKFRSEIKQLQFIEYEKLLKEYDEVRKIRLEYLLKLKNKILLELDNRNLKDVKVIDLINILEKTDNKINEFKRFNSLNKDLNDNEVYLFNDGSNIKVNYD